MLPSTTVAALLLVALIPGYAFLRLTEHVRRPRDHSTLEEFLEVLAVGLGTTGIAAVGMVVAWPLAVTETIGSTSLSDPEEVRGAVLATAILAALALGIACLAAWVTNVLARDAYSPNVWRSTLGLRMKKHLPYVVLDLKDEQGRLQGVLHTYTTLEGDHPRDISLLRPKITRNGQTWESGAGYVIVNADDIQRIWLTLALDPGQPE